MDSRITLRRTIARKGWTETPTKRKNESPERDFSLTMISRFVKLILDNRKAAFLCIAIGLLVGAGILTVFLLSTERSPFLLR